MPHPRDILVPAAVSLIILSLAWRAWRSQARPLAGGYWGAAAALAAGYASSFRSITGDWPPFPPIDATGWTLYLAAGVALLSILLESILRLPIVVRWIGLCLLFIAMFAILFANKLRFGVWTGWEAVGWIATAGILTTMWWISFEHVANVGERIAVACAAPILAAAVALMLMMSGSIILGRLGLAVTGAAIPLAIMALWRKDRFGPQRGGNTVLSALLGCLLWSGYHLAELGPWPLGLLGAAPLLLWVGRAPGLRRLPVAARTVAMLAAVMVPLALAAALVVPQFLDTLRSGSDPYAP
ncbi:hypothetical protein [Fontivita pretiosa]|uniref:hypothetical protein n=1 Tax=Fontivita pretiosa TaxID=2989684 RepID=UPI003D182B40